MYRQKHHEPSMDPFARQIDRMKNIQIDIYRQTLRLRIGRSIKTKNGKTNNSQTNKSTTDST